MPRDHPLAASPEITLEQLQNESWIIDSKDAICSQWLRTHMEALGIRAHIPYRADEYDAQLALTAHGLGVCLIPRLGHRASTDHRQPTACRPTASPAHLGTLSHSFQQTAGNHHSH